MVLNLAFVVTETRRWSVRWQNFQRWVYNRFKSIRLKSDGDGRVEQRRHKGVIQYSSFLSIWWSTCVGHECLQSKPLRDGRKKREKLLLLDLTNTLWKKSATKGPLCAERCERRSNQDSPSERGENERRERARKVRKKVQRRTRRGKTLRWFDNRKNLSFERVCLGFDYQMTLE